MNDLLIQEGSARVVSSQTCYAATTEPQLLVFYDAATLSRRLVVHQTPEGGRAHLGVTFSLPDIALMEIAQRKNVTYVKVPAAPDGSVYMPEVIVDEVLRRAAALFKEYQEKT